ncbi:hypothetical protein Daura_43475 [Dactylosporangium aurantiacum]|uniref:Uncharacterized protein n=1 Tax=Dactylosporangium aurantiacum TaxID=35754 RepID=A0A9Q9IFJ8_9ACTN|nr:hypothetical protein [Dactylosporangium aurantiacum]MDG6102357.1 hypothetical protein [Dactylosporangium aurantiacum]UWZ53345.1 hypothetical protein Daura_43475 [Dactylosporangium aurantiacum]
MRTVALSESQNASPALIGGFGALVPVFALLNLGLRWWAQQRVRAGRSLPGPLGTLRLFVDHPKLFLAGLGLEVAVGLVLIAVAVSGAAD